MTMPRLMFVALLLVLTNRSFAAEPAAEWITLFDGKSLNGWTINENAETWKVADGAITCNGPRSHLFYAGSHFPFKDFEFEAEVLTRNNSNAGIYFHTKFQETGWPDAGFECQVNNTYNTDPRKTASIYKIQDITEQIVPDDEWFKYNITVQGKTVTVKINGKTANEYVEPDDAEKKLSEGTFALQGHDPGSTVSFRNIRVRKLPAQKKEAAVSAESDSAGVQVGDEAPKFTLKDDQGKDWNSTEYFKKGITVVYFYPADFTGGCTKQACSYRDDFSPLKDLGVNVVGISGDSVETHQKFKQHHGLNFALLADSEGKAAKAFGTPFTLGEKTASFEGQTFVRTATTQRFTYVIKDGKVAAAYKVSDAAGDSKKIQDLVKNLK